jgi:ATP-dependent Lon protease
LRDQTVQRRIYPKAGCVDDPLHRSSGGRRLSGGCREHHLARTRALYDLGDVQGALERSKGRSPELEAFYERMLDTGAERFVTTPSSTAALAPLAEECPNFDEVLGDLTRYLGLAHAGDGGLNVMPILLLGDPGVGKTHFARRLARVMQTDFELISMNALSAGLSSRGVRQAGKEQNAARWPERLVRGSAHESVVVLDEVEKQRDRRSRIR